jgi:hypothetical protein
MSDWIQFYSLRGRRLTVSLPGLTKGVLSKKLTSPRAQWQHWQRKWGARISVPSFVSFALSKNAVIDKRNNKLPSPSFLCRAA